MADLGNYLIDTVIKIDKLQKEIIHDESTCISCEASLLARAYNTIPVSFSSCCGMPFTANLDYEGNTTQFFRIESIRDQRFVTLRLLEVDPSVTPPSGLIGTNFTCILDLTCCGQLQCYEAINILKCN